MISKYFLAFMITVASLNITSCATTHVRLSPAPLPVCDASASALVLWAPEWRSNQKDVAEREEAAAAGLRDFFANSGCFAVYELRRTASLEKQAIETALQETSGRYGKAVTIGVRELGPLVKLLSSPALVEGGTEVVLEVSVRSLPSATDKPAVFTIHWHHGGPGVIKGVASLPVDMQAALRAGLMATSNTQ